MRRFRYTVGQNPAFPEIRGYIISGEVNGPYGSMDPPTLSGRIINRCQVNTSNDLVIFALGPVGLATEQITGVDSVRMVLNGTVLDMPWNGTTNRYQANDAAFSDAVAAAIGTVADLTILAVPPPRRNKSDSDFLRFTQRQAEFVPGTDGATLRGFGGRGKYGAYKPNTVNGQSISTLTATATQVELVPDQGQIPGKNRVELWIESGNNLLINPILMNWVATSYVVGNAELFGFLDARQGVPIKTRLVADNV